MDDTLALRDTSGKAPRRRLERTKLSQPIGKWRLAMRRVEMKALAVIPPQMPISGIAKMQRLFEHCIEHRREVAGRGIDDAQHLGRRGLLVERLARLGDEARVLHRDDRLRREVLPQRD